MPERLVCYSGQTVAVIEAKVAGVDDRSSLVLCRQSVQRSEITCNDGMVPEASQSRFGR